MTICVRVRLSTTTIDRVAPTCTSPTRMATSALLLDGTLGHHRNHPGRHDQLTRPDVSVLGDRLGEAKHPGPLALPFPTLTGALRCRQLHAGTKRLVVLEGLLGVQDATRLANETGGLPARAEPRLARLWAQRVVGVELGPGHGKGGRRNDTAHCFSLGAARVAVGRVGVADSPREHEDVGCLHREALDRHWTPSAVADGKPAGSMKWCEEGSAGLGGARRRGPRGWPWPVALGSRGCDRVDPETGETKLLDAPPPVSALHVALMVVTEALHGPAVLGIVDPVEHRPDPTRFAVAGELDGGHVALVDRDCGQEDLGDVLDERVSPDRGGFGRLREHRVLDVEDQVIGEQLTPVGPVLGVHEPEVPRLELVEIKDVLCPVRAHCVPPREKYIETLSNPWGPIPCAPPPRGSHLTHQGR